jgi:hypothetical protein
MRSLLVICGTAHEESVDRRCGILMPGGFPATIFLASGRAFVKLRIGETIAVAFKVA